MVIRSSGSVLYRLASKDGADMYNDPCPLLLLFVFSSFVHQAREGNVTYLRI